MDESRTPRLPDIQFDERRPRADAHQGFTGALCGRLYSSMIGRQAIGPTVAAQAAQESPAPKPAMTSRVGAFLSCEPRQWHMVTGTDAQLWFPNFSQMPSGHFAKGSPALRAMFRMMNRFAWCNTNPSTSSIAQPE